MPLSDKLTEASLRALKPAAGPRKLFDGGGLFLLVSPAGTRLWRLKYRYAGHEKLLALGAYPQVPLRLARRRRDDARRLLEAGTDPSAKRKADRAARIADHDNTLERIAREWLGKKSHRWDPGNAGIITRRLEADVFPWVGKEPIATVSKDSLLRVLERIERRGAVETAHRIRQYVDAVFRYAMDTGRAHANPTPRPEVLAAPRQRHFASITDPKAVGGLMRAIRSYQGSLIVQCALKLAPLVFVRPGELRRAEWSELDLETAEWRIPAEKMKMRSPHFVPLSRQAVAILRDLQPLTGRWQWVFPSERSRQRPMSANTVNAALRALGYSKAQITGHGFRHMASTLLNESSLWNRDAIERQLAHAEKDEIRAVYNAAQYLPERRRMMQWWADRLDELAA
ncbi:MAG: integrase arm-type DNA-binding domain-containing protein [Steroidobacteraceae bacterium]